MLGQNAPLGPIVGRLGGMQMLWKIDFRTDSGGRIIEINDSFMGENVLLEEYDFQNVALIE